MKDYQHVFEEFPQKINTSSLKERKLLIENVINLLSTSTNINDVTLKEICKGIHLTLQRYSDKSSKELVIKLVKTLTKSEFELGIKYLCGALIDIAKKHQNIVVTRSVSVSALQAFSWSYILFENGWKNHNKTLLDLFKNLAESQAVLYSTVIVGGVNKLSVKAFKIFSASLKSVPGSEKLYLESLSNIQDDNVIVLKAAVAKHLITEKENDIFSAYSEPILNAYVQQFITVKKEPLAKKIEACGPIFNYVNDDLFKKILLPAIKKSMLRNPEVLINCMPAIISNAAINIDMSPYACELGNSLITMLYAQNSAARESSVKSLQVLARDCKSPNSVEEILKQIFSVFGSSDGKLTIIEQKLNILEGAGRLNVVLPNFENKDSDYLIKKSIDYFAKVLQKEVTEKIVCYSLEMLSLWTSNIKNEIPSNLIEMFKIGLKSSSSVVRSSYLTLILETFKNNKLELGQAKELNPILSKFVENAVNQPSQIPVLTEGMLATLIILNSSIFEKENSLFNANAVFDMEKQIFTSEKFLTSIKEEYLVYLVQLYLKMLLNYNKKITGDNLYLYQSAIYCLISTSSEIRRKCLTELKNAIEVIEDSTFVRSLLKHMVEYFKSDKVNAILSKKNSENKEDCNSTNQSIVNLILVTCCSRKFSQEENESIALESLLPCHFSFVYSKCCTLWDKVLNYLSINPKTLIYRHNQYFKKNLIDEFSLSSAAYHALSTVAHFNSDVILPPLIEDITSKLSNPKICQITKDEYFTFLTPEGELYDKSVMPGDESNMEINMKRESKAYSYKEQLEELQLRRELAEKKRKEGKIKPPQYTPKQLEAINNQKAKEQAIRNNLKNLNFLIKNCESMINAVSHGNPVELSLHFKNLLPILIKNFQSPLAAPIFTDLFINLRNIVFQNGLLGDIVANITLRILKPKCDLNVEWEKEDIDKAITRTIDLIFIKNSETKFTSPTFCYLFPLLQNSLLLQYNKKNEETIQQGLHIITEQAKYSPSRFQDQILNDSFKTISVNDKDVFNPQYLPIKNMLEFLILIISKTSGRIQSQSQACLLDVVSCLTGNEGCTTPSNEDIDILLEGLQSPLEIVRDSVLRALLIIVHYLSNLKTDPKYNLLLNKRIFIAKFDHVKENSELAEKLWIEASMDFPSENSEELLTDISHYCEPIQAAAAKALGYLLEESKAPIESTLQTLLVIYKDRLQMIPAQVDEFGREVEKAIDTWQPRRGVALALYQLAPLMNQSQIGDIVQFFVSNSLSDRKETVRKEMLNAALRIVDLHGKETVGTLWPVFDVFMSKTSKSANFDAVKQAVVILMGSLARHLEQDDPKIKPIVMRLIQALSTPSQSVQEAVANCLHPLCGFVKEDIPGLINKLLHQLLKGDNYGQRKGAAYGIASIIKGIGILGLKQYDIMTKLTEAIQDKKNYKFREGALFAFEMLFQMLGKLFEPYIVHVLPHLLQCFGDSSQHVRTAADDTAKVIMSKLSGHGVKLILPSLLDALNEDSWRTKTGSVELLGAMAYCAPKQLSSCLPSIVPKLIEVLSDSHIKVQEAGAAALKVIGSVIRNPEIQAIVPVLLRALQDPSTKTSACLQTLLDTQFVHFIDAPSLALIMPVVQRAFIDRSTETRKMAAQIIGNMYSLTDQKDLVPYLPTIIPGLKTSLLDPVPEVRSVSARALGAMVRGMGESSFEDLLPWLMQTLTSESSSVDRSGAAQGLSEVVGGLGIEKLHKIMPEIIATAERTDIAPHVKDGYIMMFIYMPTVFNNDFTPYIGQIITPILKALSDENEYVRDTALKAGQRIVTLYADSAILLLLPELEKGLFDENWRIRYSSVQLLGDLLYRISGVTGKMSTETASEDDNFGTEQSHQAIINALGAERRNRVLAGLYMGRSDVALMVRQAALHVWKVVVTNTPRTLREILPTLFGLLLGCLASDSYDKRQVAARTLGDLVRKLGERVLPEIIPILERGLESERSDQRQGVCIGLSEIMTSTSKDMVLTFVNSLVPTVRKALCDPLPEVRKAAAKTFDSLHSTVGSRALDDIIPTMLNQLNDDNPETVECTLDGLRQMMSIKSRVVLPYLVPQLTAPPANTKALSIVASVAGEALNRFLPKILPALQMSLARSKGTPEEVQELEYCQAVILSVIDEAGTRIVVDTILENTRNEDPDIRRAATTLLCSFCSNSKAHYLMHVPQLLRGLIHLCTDTDPDILKMSWEALNAVTKTLDPKQLPTYVSDIRQAVRFAMSDMKGASTELPGFCIQKGIAPILPIFREAILNGDSDDKEMAALGLGEVIKVTSDKALQPSVVHITGPLIRILGDRFSANVKIAVLDTLAILLSKVGVMLKQFLPQLQTTFIKALNDPNRDVRLKSAQALRYLIVIHQRPDPLFTELHNTLLKTDDAGIRETTLHGLRGIISPAGDKMSEGIRKQVIATLINFLSHNDDVTRNCAAGCLGALCRWLQPKELTSVVSEELLNDSTTDLSLRQSRSAALSVTLKESPETIWNSDYEAKIISVLLSRLAADNVAINIIAVRSCGYLFKYLMLNKLALPHQLMVQFARAMNNNNNEVKQHFVKLCIHIARNVPSDDTAPEFLKIILPGLVNGTKEKNIYVKANSEIALMTILKLKEGDAMQNKCLNILDIGARESLSDVVSKVLRKIQHSEGKEEELDDTLLT